MKATLREGLELLMATLVLASCAESTHQQARLNPAGTPELPAQEVTGMQGGYWASESHAFTDVKAMPSRYQGQVVVFSGSVIAAKRLDGRTEIEVLHLPMGLNGRPTRDRSQSNGRFLAVQDSFLDPETLAPNTPITIVGNVSGEMVRPLNEGADDYVYPVISIIEITPWTAEFDSDSAQRSAHYLDSAAASPSRLYDSSALVLARFLRAFIAALFSNDQPGSVDSSSSSSSSSSSKPSGPSDRTRIPPQFQKHQQ